MTSMTKSLRASKGRLTSSGTRSQDRCRLGISLFNDILYPVVTISSCHDDRSTIKEIFIRSFSRGDSAYFVGVRGELLDTIRKIGLSGQLSGAMS